MKKICTLCVFTVVLASCTTLSLTPDSRLYELNGEFNTALRLVNTYSTQPFCQESHVTACAEKSVVLTLSQYSGAVKSALESARASSSEEDYLSAIALARYSLNRLTTTLIKHGVLSDE